MRGEPLMPTAPRKARVLLVSGRAKVAKRTPFTVQLLYPTGETKQPVSLGVDAGYSKVGLSAVVPGGQELFSAEVELRSDIVKLISCRRTYRRARRGRKTWHRKPRFLNRKKPEGWLAPSIQHKQGSHLKLVREVKKILPVSKITVEVASFDIQKLQNPDVSGKGYQEGPRKDFENVREYVLFRDNHTCRNCKGKSGDPVLQVHHVVSRQTGGNRPENLMTVCKTCHDSHNRRETPITAKPVKGFRPEAFMNTVRRRLVSLLGEENVCPVSATFGYITKSNRIALSLPKSHANDAFVIAGGNGEERASDTFFSKQVRSNNRKLFKGVRSHLKNTAPRFVQGFQRYDKVLYAPDGNGPEECFIFGRRSSGYFDVRKVDGTKVHSSAAADGLVLLESAKTLLTERRTAAFLPHLTEGVSSRL
ncbi:MAG: HNH endonuclease [Actinobacteria bacterium]|nr:HNH endonuclease [Actinomycetota bacterium]MBU4179385.1 HNH endonuclease [Actinomycetota bacterium]MBU4218275.1 HNH endonuclease [Actinomycetota bacterium]MBU4358700.1 HNH endonuclease [Actinomycetota bacterium]MBU4391985.1 HNH endonuclease [Actinomycetota bacterium]